MSYAILRISKLKNLGTATSATQHNYRLQATPNANPDWAALNEELLNHGHRNYWHLANERIDELHLPRLRNDAVRAVELVLTASPESFQRDADGRALDVRGTPWVQNNFDFLTKRFGEKDVVSFTLHQDEVTPHIHAVVIPTTADGRLSSRDVFSPTSLRQLQTDYAKAMAPHGLERGIQYSTAIHEDVRRHYGAQQAGKAQLAEWATPLPTAPHRLRPLPAWLEPENYRRREQHDLDHYLHELTKAGNQKIARLAAVASANALAHDRVRVLEKQLARSQAQLALAREGLTPRIARLTKQLLQAQQELVAKTAEITEQKARIGRQSMNHLRAVMKHLQGEPLSEKVTAWGQEQRQHDQKNIERLLAKQFLQPLQQVADIGPAFLEKGYVLQIIGTDKFTLTHEQKGMCFSSTELRPNGRDCVEQFRVAVGRTQTLERGRGLSAPSKDIEMD